MYLTSETVLEDLLNYVKDQGFVFSTEALKIFSKVEHLCRSYNVCPFSQEYLLILLEEVPLFQQIIRKYGGQPDLALSELYKNLQGRDESDGGFDYDSSDLYSNLLKRELITRSRILDLTLDNVKRNNRKQIYDTDIIEALLNIHDEYSPVWNNGDYRERRLHTSFNTLAHITGFYCDYLWVRFEDIRRELNEIDIYDLAISFAGEDREVAKSIAHLVTKQGLRTFYDEYEKGDLWGKDLFTHLTEVYSKKARFCLMIVSEFYARKKWTTVERKAAQAKAFQEDIEYILPLRLDDTEIPGLLPTIGYIDLRQSSIEEVAVLLKRKLIADQCIEK
ncbi:toll/interleukin-1 receptor domain-containing protein [Desulforamulus ruminis]|uniref:TIR protein n=1 Tax=Desulforamulus ruminis (strain ATCC 23193 / DSM 2154 / NCIMB 8452 / DL) TaxID=696281 RepID=F6DUI2_DESRL|nr:TIR domain-containing protein [Desulforamulus ruminis]AEG59049.1 TIR protein [Desulforamulus ruminis DSM 2154]